MSALPEKRTAGQWVQTERAAHEAWASLIEKAPKAAQLMHILTARVGEHNAVVVSQKTLSALMKCSRRTVQRAVDVLVEDRWIEVRQIGENGTVNAHIINDRVAWSGKRDGIRYSLFTAAVIVSDEEQPDRDQIDHQAPLRRLPSLFRGEQQLPSGNGLPLLRNHSSMGWSQTCPPLTGQYHPTLTSRNRGEKGGQTFHTRGGKTLRCFPANPAKSP